MLGAYDTRANQYVSGFIISSVLLLCIPLSLLQALYLQFATPHGGSERHPLWRSPALLHWRSWFFDWLPAERLSLGPAGKCHIIYRGLGGDFQFSFPNARLATAAAGDKARFTDSGFSQSD